MRIRTRTGLSVVVAAVAAAASFAPSAAAQPTAAPPAATSHVSPLTNGPQICDYPTTGLCLNADGGHHVSGDYVIAYTNGDPNNTFEAVQLTGICQSGGGVGAGYVHNGEGGILCPFPDGSGLNARYDKDAIVEFQDYTTFGALCVASSGSGTGSAGLGACSPDRGWGGATGEVFILSGVTNFGDMGVSPFYAVNYHYSTSLGEYCGHMGATYKPCWMVSAGKGNPVYINYPSALNQWFQAP